MGLVIPRHYWWIGRQPTHGGYNHLGYFKMGVIQYIPLIPASHLSEVDAVADGTVELLHFYERIAVHWLDKELQYKSPLHIQSAWIGKSTFSASMLKVKGGEDGRFPLMLTHGVSSPN
jgi:hypothetical protein